MIFGDIQWLGVICQTRHLKGWPGTGFYISIKIIRYDGQFLPNVGIVFMCWHIYRLCSTVLIMILILQTRHLIG